MYYYMLRLRRKVPSDLITLCQVVALQLNYSTKNESCMALFRRPEPNSLGTINLID